MGFGSEILPADKYRSPKHHNRLDMATFRFSSSLHIFRILRGKQTRPGVVHIAFDRLQLEQKADQEKAVVFIKWTRDQVRGTARKDGAVHQTR